MKITVIGCGRWGTFIAYYLHNTGHDVKLYGKTGDPTTVGLLTTRKNSYLTLPDDFRIITDINEALSPTPSRPLISALNSQSKI